ncbi:hypothetical protein AcW1_003907 [Taiwanofungus camphoratus]|nr:hypothetical protein AcW1_003907 [Antrodia cinnamomea]
MTLQDVNKILQATFFQFDFDDEPTFASLQHVNLIADIIVIMEHSYWYSDKTFITKVKKAFKQYQSSGGLPVLKEHINKTYSMVRSEEGFADWLYDCVQGHLMAHPATK